MKLIKRVVAKAMATIARQPKQSSTSSFSKAT
jgi:hypothetical protein